MCTAPTNPKSNSKSGLCSTITNEKDTVALRYLCFCGTAVPLPFLEACIHLHTWHSCKHAYISLLLSHNMKNTLTYQRTVLASYELQRQGFSTDTEIMCVIHRAVSSFCLLDNGRSSQMTWYYGNAGQQKLSSTQSCYLTLVLRFWGSK